MIYLAVVTTEGESALHALVLTPVPADGAEQPRRFLWRWNDGGKIARRGWGEVPDALQGENQHSSQGDSVSGTLTDSSIRVSRFFLYRRAVLMFIVDFLFGWTDGRLSDIKV